MSCRTTSSGLIYECNWSPQGRRGQKILEETMAISFPNWMKALGPQEGQWTPSTRNMKKQYQGIS